ncbi:hypothetical protein FNF28_02826 [Cafeteria roenbergensis]|uniref:Tubulin--tyrosine ligase-like protein 9 n=1 Tax=Cafeteria roenbergensis TaxID=33653 RepID=A0A5A8DRG0_CAFRO|nr:hypothetical protein FNF28_02826 [Cafeteria roenbergensis]
MSWLAGLECAASRAAYAAGVGAREGAAEVPAVVVVDSDCPYQRRLLRLGAVRRSPSIRAIAASAPKAAKDQAVAFVDEYERIPWELVMRKPHLVANSFCIRKSLIRKANLAAHVDGCERKSAARRAGVAGGGRAPSGPMATAQASLGCFVPESTVVDLFEATTSSSAARAYGGRRAAIQASLDEDVGEILPDSAEPGGPVWLLKPSMGNKGGELHLVRCFDDAVKATASWPDVAQWVLQRYVAPPLTALGGRKFHLRVYVMARGALDVYVYRQALVLLATLPHAKAAGAAGGELVGEAAHSLITNTCFAAERAGFDEARSVRLLSELPEALDAPGEQGAAGPGAGSAHAAACAASGAHWGEEATRVVYGGVREAVARLFASLQGSVGGFMPLPNAYELYGLDFVVRSTDLRPMLLEVNAGPDLKQTGGRLQGLISNLLDDTMETSLMPMVRAKLAGKFVEPGAGPEIRASLAARARSPAVPSWAQWDGVEPVALRDSLEGALPGTDGGFRLGEANGWDPVLSMDWHVQDMDVSVSAGGDAADRE